MTTTATELAEIVRQDFLLTGQREQRNQLGAGVDASVLDWTMKHSGHNLGVNHTLSCGFEDVGIWEVVADVVTVLRGDFSSTAAAHAADDVVLVNSDYSPAKVLRALQETIKMLNNTPSLYVPATVDFDPPHGDRSFDLAAVDPDKVIEVLIETDDDDQPWIRSHSWDVIRNADSTGGFTGAALVVHDAINYSGIVRAVYKSDLGQITATTTDVETDVGIDNMDLLGVGAAIRLTAGRPVRRTSMSAQGDSRRANEVAGFTTGNSTRELQRQYKMLLDAEISRLKQQFPYRRHQR